MSSTGSLRSHPSPTASKTDPFKEMTRKLDARIYARGGRSIFGTPHYVLRYVEPPSTGLALRDDVVKPSYYAPARGRPRHIPKPQRIMGHTYGILGGGSLRDFDEGQ